MRPTPCKVWKDPGDAATARSLLERYEFLLREKIREWATFTPQDFRREGIKNRDPRSFAVRQLAIEDGVQHNTMKQKLTRARSTLGTKAESKNELLKFDGIDTFALPVPNDWKQQQLTVRKRFWSVYGQLQSLNGILSATCEQFGYPASYRESLKSVMAETQRRLYAFTPVGLCRYCKGLDPYQGECTHCERSGIGVASQLEQCPEELKREAPLMVMWRGKLVEVKR